MKMKNDRRSQNEEMIVAVNAVNAIYAFIKWFISYIINTHFFHGNILTHNWPAPNVSGFITQLVEHRTGKSRGHGFKALWSPEFFFQASLRNCIKCVHCDDHFFIFISFPQFIDDLFHISLTQWIVFFALSVWLLNQWIYCTITDSLPLPPSERHQTRVSCEQNAFPVCCRNKQRNFTTNEASCFQNTRRRWRSSVWKF